MDKTESKYLQLNRLNEGIEELREVLNEICSTVEESEKDKKRLTISKNLDELIVEYMKELNKLSEINKKISE
ncbi:aspartyl-phosphate phosphatase Spo0E family protein [Candidatus Clostridium radicumherbarum]|uniref:Aspartyl-phosphate phosphatase Spo0E family protein n=1 Tax=Candidatus Clostridium radicumherbarum TaxID=3381662 RepID=A0ABW8TYF8_9CLOT